MRAETGRPEPTQDSALEITTAEVPHLHAATGQAAPAEPADVAGPVEVAEPVRRPDRDPNTPPRGRERDAERARTQDLIGLLDHATPLERRAIRDEVVTLHLWLATSAARRYGPRSEYDDLVQVARGGLVEAFDRYDPSQTTYAYFAWVTMTGLLRRYLRDHGWSVRPPRSVQEAANVLRGTVQPR